MKYFLTFTAGFLIGAAGSMLWLRKEFQNKINETESRIKEADRKLHEKEEKESNKKNDKSTERKDFVKRTGTKKQIKEYNKIIVDCGYDATESEKKDLENNKNTDDGSSETSEKVVSQPYGISEEDFIHSYKEEYDKVDLYFYRVDGILCEEDGTVIENDIYCLGEDWRELIGKFEEDTAYIRNERMATDYCVTCEDLSYEEEYGE